MEDVDLGAMDSGRTIHQRARVTERFDPSHLTTPTRRLLESRSASGCSGSMICSHSSEMSALRMNFLLSFLKEALAPIVAASLQHAP